MNSDAQIQYKFLKTKDKGWFNVKIDFDELEQELNKLGEDRWDLVTSLDVNHGRGATKEVVLLLKRYV